MLLFDYEMQIRASSSFLLMLFITLFHSGIELVIQIPEKRLS